MQPMAQAPDMQDPAMPVPGEEMTTESPGEGYCIRICVYPDRMTVTKGPLLTEESESEEAEMMGGEPPQPVQTFEDALKAAVRIYKQNPLGASDDKHFDVGFEQGHGSQGMEG